MVQIENQMQKASEGGPIDWAVADVRLIKLALWYLVFQLAIDWILYFFFSSNVEISRSVHSLFAEMDHVTPALARLKAYYGAPINGREFSQVFAIYFSLLALFCLYLMGLCGLLLSRKFRSLPWRKMFARSDLQLLLILVSPIGFYGIYFFFVGPGSLPNYSGFFGGDVTTTMCVFLPGGQFLILCTLAFFYSVREFLARKSTTVCSMAFEGSN